MIADAHVDILLELAHREHRLGETDVFARTWLPLLEAGDVGLQVCPVFVDLELQPEGTLREALRQVTALQHALRESPDRLVAVRSRADLDAVERGERIGLMLALEGVEPFGYEVATADLFWELGLRMAGLTWNRRNPFADGAADEGGLSRLGRSSWSGSPSSASSSTSRTRLLGSSTSASSPTRAESASPMRAAAPSTRRRATSPTSSSARSPTATACSD